MPPAIFVEGNIGCLNIYKTSERICFFTLKPSVELMVKNNHFEPVKYDFKSISSTDLVQKLEVVFLLKIPRCID